MSNFESSSALGAQPTLSTAQLEHLARLLASGTKMSNAILPRKSFDQYLLSGNFPQETNARVIPSTASSGSKVFMPNISTVPGVHQIMNLSGVSSSEPHNYPVDRYVPSGSIPQGTGPSKASNQIKFQIKSNKIKTESRSQCFEPSITAVTGTGVSQNMNPSSVSSSASAAFQSQNYSLDQYLLSGNIPQLTVPGKEPRTTSSGSQFFMPSFTAGPGVSQIMSATGISSPASAAFPPQINLNPMGPQVILPVPDGTGYTRYPEPDIKSLMFDPATGYRFDSFTGLYYEANSKNFINKQLNLLLQYDKLSSMYIRVGSASSLPKPKMSKEIAIVAGHQVAIINSAPTRPPTPPPPMISEDLPSNISKVTNQSSSMSSGYPQENTFHCSDRSPSLGRGRNGSRTSERDEQPQRTGSPCSRSRSPSRDATKRSRSSITRSSKSPSRNSVRRSRSLMKDLPEKSRSPRTNVRSRSRRRVVSRTSRSPKRDPVTRSRSHRRDPPKKSLSPRKDQGVKSDPNKRCRRPSRDVSRTLRSPRQDPIRRSRSPRRDLPRKSRSPRRDPVRRSRSPRKDPQKTSKSPTRDPGRRSRSPRRDISRKSLSPRTVRRSRSPRTDLTRKTMSSQRDPVRRSKSPRRDPPRKLRSPRNDPVGRSASPRRDPPGSSRKDIRIGLPRKSRSPRRDPVKRSKSPRRELPRRDIPRESGIPKRDPARRSKSPNARPRSFQRDGNTRARRPIRNATKRSRTPRRETAERSRNPRNDLCKTSISPRRDVTETSRSPRRNVNRTSNSDRDEFRRSSPIKDLRSKLYPSQDRHRSLSSQGRWQREHEKGERIESDDKHSPRKITGKIPDTRSDVWKRDDARRSFSQIASPERRFSRSSSSGSEFRMSPTPEVELLDPRLSPTPATPVSWSPQSEEPAPPGTSDICVSPLCGEQEELAVSEISESPMTEELDDLGVEEIGSSPLYFNDEAPITLDTSASPLAHKAVKNSLSSLPGKKMKEEKEDDEEDPRRLESKLPCPSTEFEISVGDNGRPPTDGQNADNTDDSAEKASQGDSAADVERAVANQVGAAAEKVGTATS